MMYQFVYMIYFLYLYCIDDDYFEPGHALSQLFVDFKKTQQSLLKLGKDHRSENCKAKENGESDEFIDELNMRYENAKHIEFDVFRDQSKQFVDLLQGTISLIFILHLY